jgi:hypothetical protein
MDSTPNTPQEVKHVENSAIAQNASNTLMVIGLVIGIFGLIAISSYFFFVKTYSSAMENRQENAMLYDDPSQKNILGAQITDLPELQIGGNKNLNKQPPMTQQQLMQAQMMQQQQAMQQKAPQNKPDVKPPTPTNTPVPANTYVNDTLHFTLNNQGWTKQAQTKDGEITVDSYKNDSGSLILYITTTTKSYDTVKAYLDTTPRGRKPESTSDFSLGGEGGQKSTPYTVSTNGTTYMSIGAYVKPRVDTGMIGVELDSTSLDVNDHTAEDTFKKITDSFTFIEKKSP